MAKEHNRNFEIAPHKEGMRIKAWGRTLEELFLHVLQGLTEYLVPDIREREKTESKVTQRLTAEAVDLNSLLVEFVTAVIGYCDMQNLVFTDAAFTKLGENFLEAELTGIGINGMPEKEIKEVRYDEIEVKRSPKTGLYETLLVLEV